MADLPDIAQTSIVLRVAFKAQVESLTYQPDGKTVSYITMNEGQFFQVVPGMGSFIPGTYLIIEWEELFFLLWHEDDRVVMASIFDTDAYTTKFGIECITQ